MMSTKAPHPKATEREAYYQRIEPQHLTPLWEVLGNLVTPQPASGCQAHLWRYDDVRAPLMEAGELITAKEAERRVLVLENPGLRGQSRITTSLYAGVQLVKPGEVAPAHRHTQTALRFVLEGDDAHTAVEGERTRMHPGDFVITPSWTWHDHGNDSDKPMVWLDGLDIAVVQLFDASFAEHLDTDEQAVARPEGDSQARYGSGLLPVDYAVSSVGSPIFNYRYDKSREALEAMRRTEEWDACHGLKMRYVNPVNGDYAMATMGAFLQLLPKGFESAAHRATDATVFVCVEGEGSSIIGDKTFTWGPRDIFVAPSWHWTRHVASSDAVLFSFSDRPIQEKLGLWRQDRGNA